MMWFSTMCDVAITPKTLFFEQDLERWRYVLTIFVAGDEVIEWNGRNLRGLLFEEVYDIIFESKQEPQVELIVHRPIRWEDMRHVKHPLVLYDNSTFLILQSKICAYLHPRRSGDLV